MWGWCLPGLLVCAAALGRETTLRPLDVADLAAPAFEVYTAQDGLSDEIWSTVGFDPDGYVWAGSASELARFDGYRWTPWPMPGVRSLVRDLQVGGDGTLWAAFEREGVMRLEGGTWRRAGETRFVQQFSESVRADGTVDLWIAHRDGISYLEGERWVPDPGTHEGEEAPSAPVGIAETHTLFGEARQWLATRETGLWFRPIRDRQRPEPWRRVEAPELRQMPMTDVLRAVDRGREELWALSYGGGVARLREHGIRLWRAGDGGLPSEALYSAISTHSADGAHTLWMASRAGLVRIHGDDITAYDRRHGLPSDAIRTVKRRRVDDVDVLWIATEGGIARAALTRSAWQTVSLHGARENGIFGILLEPDGRGGERLWIGSAQQGIALLQDGAWRVFSRAGGELPGSGVRTLVALEGPDGRTWRLAGLTSGHLMRIDDALRFHPLPAPWPVAAESTVVAALSRRVESEVELWFATVRHGVYRLRAGRWEHFALGDTDAPGPAATVLAFADQTDADGRRWLWAAGSQGLSRFDGSAWVTMPADLGLQDGLRALTVIEENGRPVLWASSLRLGVIRLDVADALQPRRLPADQVPLPPDPTVYSVLRDSVGRLYVCTNNGVQQLSPRADGGWTERVFRRRDGLVHDECNTGSQWIDARDRYWVGTLGGLSVFDPAVEQAAGDAVVTPKPLRFTQLRVDGVAQTLAPGQAWRIAAGARELRVDYALLSGLRESESTYRTQLVGHDPYPSRWSSEHSRSFSALDPGSYRLRVDARDHTGHTVQSAALDLVLAPYWWQRTSVRVGIGLLLIGVAAGGAALYNRGLRARQRQLTREVALRTDELNRANLRLTELSYVDALTGVANRRRLTEAIDAAIQRAIAQGRAIGLIVLDVDHFKDYNDRHGHLAGDAALRAVAQAIEQATREQDLVARFGGEEFACLLIDADLDQVVRIAERMRALVEALPPRMLGNDSHTLTISAGVSCRIPRAGEQAADLLRDADTALYRAKHAGRNRVCLARAEDGARPPP